MRVYIFTNLYNNLNKIAMKRLMIIIIATVLTTNVHSQDYLISFEGSGDTTIVDSVIIKNLTQETNITVNGNDQLRLVENVTEINIVGDLKDNALLIYPNPTKEYSIVKFEVPQAGFMTIQVYDILGKKALQESKYFEKGTHFFQISGLACGIYNLNLNIKTSGLNYTGKIVSQNNNRGLSQINYKGQIDKIVNANQLKSKNTEVQMQYNSGDRLKLTGISGNYSTVVIDIPTESKSITFNFIACTDENENNYPIVKIGNQVWMAENLKTTKYNGGTAIPLVTDSAAWSNLTTPGYCWYDNDSATYANPYGALYNWYTVGTGNLCPTGWHVPTKAKWTTLTDYLGGENVAGGKLKETGTTHWANPNEGATNETGFTALPGGSRIYSGIGYYGFWWSATEAYSDKAVSRELDFDYSYFFLFNDPKKAGFSVRCIKDD